MFHIPLTTTSHCRNPKNPAAISLFTPHMSLESSLTTRKCTVCWAHKGQVRWSSPLKEPEACREAEVTEEQEQHQCPEHCLSLREKRRRRMGDTEPWDEEVVRQGRLCPCLGGVMGLCRISEVGFLPGPESTRIRAQR